MDEIQNVDNFQKVVNSLRVQIKNISVFLTGSNSKMLLDDLSSVLYGRSVLFNINLLSYKGIVFLTKKDGNIKYIQVTYEMLGNDNSIEREFGAYKPIEDNYPIYVISLDKIDLSCDGIIIDFLLKD